MSTGHVSLQQSIPVLCSNLRYTQNDVHENTHPNRQPLTQPNTHNTHTHTHTPTHQKHTHHTPHPPPHHPTHTQTQRHTHTHTHTRLPKYHTAGAGRENHPSRWYRRELGKILRGDRDTESSGATSHEP